MKFRNTLFTGLLIFVFALASCNINVRVPSDQNSSAAATIVAQTLTAAAGPAVLNSPAPQVSATPNFTTLVIADNTNCRQGPGKEYSIVAVIAGGVSVQMVARSEDGKYWVVAAPNNAGACWIPSEFGTPSGNTTVLPIVTPSEKGTNTGAPERPGSLFYSYECSGGDVTTTLSWSDSSGNEDGFRLYRYGVMIADLPANSTSYVDEVIVAPGATIDYAVEAYNGSGVSAQRSSSFACQ